MLRPRRSAVSVQLLTQYGLDLGLSLDACLQNTGLDWRLLADPGAEVEAEQELQLVRFTPRVRGRAWACRWAGATGSTATASGASPCSPARPSATPPASACATWT
jgi:hypothetical protein